MSGKHSSATSSSIVGAQADSTSGTLDLASLLDNGTMVIPLPVADSSAGPTRSAHRAADGDLTFLIIGDSYSTKFSPLFNAIDDKLDETGFDVRLVSKSKGGAHLSDGAKQLAAGLKGDIDGVIMLLGSNDGLEATPLSEVERNLDKILTKLDKKDIPTLVAGTYGDWPIQEAGYPSGSDAARFESIFSRQAAAHGDIFFARLLDGAYGVDGGTEDGEHPTDQGASVIADRMAGSLFQLVSEASIG